MVLSPKPDRDSDLLKYDNETLQKRYLRINSQMHLFIICPSGYIQHEQTLYFLARILQLSELQYLLHFGSWLLTVPCFGLPVQTTSCMEAPGCSVQTEVSCTARGQREAGVKQKEAATLAIQPGAGLVSTCKVTAPSASWRSSAS